MITKPDEMIVGFQNRGPSDNSYRLGYKGKKFLWLKKRY